MTLFLTAIGLGIAFCAPPGAVNAESLRRGLAGGFTSALKVQVGSLIGDMTWSAIALAGAAVLVQSLVARIVLGAVGALFLTRLAWSALADARSGKEPAPAAPGGRGDFATGAFLSLTNPWAVAFWLGIGGSLVAFGIGDPQPIHFALFFGGFLLGAVLWCLGYSALVGWGRRYVSPGLFRVVNLVCGLVLALFALRLLWSTLTLVV